MCCCDVGVCPDSAAEHDVGIVLVGIAARVEPDEQRVTGWT